MQRESAPLSAADLAELRAAARPQGLQLSLRGDDRGERLSRLDALNRRRLLRFGGIRRERSGDACVRYALSEAGRAACRLH